MINARRGFGKGSHVIIFGEGDQRYKMTDPGCMGQTAICARRNVWADVENNVGRDCS